MQPLEGAVDSMADRTGFSGVVRVDRSGSIELAKAYGLADRGHRYVVNRVDLEYGHTINSKSRGGFGAICKSTSSRGGRNPPSGWF